MMYLFYTLLLLLSPNQNCEDSISESVSIEQKQSIEITLCDYQSDFKIDVHNRWGQILYSSESYSNKINVWEINPNETAKEKKKRLKEIKKGRRLDPENIKSGIFVCNISYVNSQGNLVVVNKQIMFQ